MPANGTKSSSNVWFSRHPVVSTVLWLIGGETDPNNLNKPPSASKLSWKDEHGGSIAEYIGEVGGGDNLQNCEGNQNVPKDDHIENVAELVLPLVCK